MSVMSIVAYSYLGGIINNARHHLFSSSQRHERRMAAAQQISEESDASINKMYVKNIGI